MKRKIIDFLLKTTITSLISTRSLLKIHTSMLGFPIQGTTKKGPYALRLPRLLMIAAQLQPPESIPSAMQLAVRPCWTVRVLNSNTTTVGIGMFVSLMWRPEAVPELQSLSENHCNSACYPDRVIEPDVPIGSGEAITYIRVPQELFQGRYANGSTRSRSGACIDRL